MRRFVALLFFVMPSLAGANSPFDKTSIKSIVVHDFGSQILVTLSGPLHNSEGCAGDGVLVLEKSQPLFREMYAALLSDYYAGGNIQGWINGCNDVFKAPELVRLDLVK